MISDAMKRNMPSTARRHARAVVDRRRAVVRASCDVRVMRARPGPRVGATRRARPAGPCPSAARSTRSRRSQPERSPGNVETMISSTRSSWTACMRGGVRVGVRDLPVRVDALAAQLGERAAQAAARPPGAARRVALRRRRSGSSPALARGARADPVEQLGRRATVSFAITRTFGSLALAATSTTTCSTGRSPAARSDVARRRSRRIQPDCSAGASRR